jgi:3-oxoacyl-[acyl-carrier protein] reductase
MRSRFPARGRWYGGSEIERHVLLTGGSRGLGLEITRHLLTGGYEVTTVSRTTTAELCALRAEHGAALHVLEADLTDLHRLPALVDEVARRGALFGLVNNAAGAVDGLLVMLSAADVERMIRLNLTAALLLARLVGKQMIRHHEGRIVNVSSIAATRAYRGLAVYAATKAGLEAATRTLALELGPRGITVNAVAPGFLETDLSAGLTARQRESIRQRTPLRMTVTPADVAAVVLFLLSPAARMITGAVLPVDGGSSL